MASTVFPETTDAAITEAAWQALNGAISGGDAHALSGFDLSDGGAGQIDAAAGTAVVSGAEVVTDATISKTLSVGNRYVWLTPTGTIGESANTTPPNGDDLFLGYIVVGAGPAISSISRAVPANDSLFESRRNNYTRHAALGTGQSSTVVAELSLEPGLYWFRAVLLVQGQALSAGQSATVSVATSGASGVDLHGAILNHTHGLYDGLFFSATAGHAMATPNNNDPHPVTVLGRLALADAGTLQISATTSAHHTVTAGGPVIAYRLQ